MSLFSKLFRIKPYKRLGLSVEDKKTISEKWSKIQELMNLKGPSRFQKAVLEADKLLFFALEKMGYPGSLGEKLKEAKDRFVDGHDYSIYDDLWKAHRLRNKIVHEVEAEVSSYEAHDVISKFEKGLKKLGVL